ncbi:hypothetical protein GJ496_000060 [Pomphorhynchus laevis]|nr:hypothetical protein GJ496_000060 [Pomphorhynchus laevis]
MKLIEFPCFNAMDGNKENKRLHTTMTGKEATHKLDGVVGFDALPEQVVNRAVQSGFCFNILCVGEPGIGKTTLLESLFAIKLLDRLGQSKLTTQISNQNSDLQKQNFILTEGNVKLRLSLIETSGYADQIDKRHCYLPIAEYIDAQFHRTLNNELRICQRNRPLEGPPADDTCVHVCLYFIEPTGHSLKALDLVTLRYLDSKVNIVPVIAKSDTLSKTELLHMKKMVSHELRDIKLYRWPTDDENVAPMNSQMNSMMPFAVVGSSEFVKVGNKNVRGRQYPWGVVQGQAQTGRAQTGRAQTGRAQTGRAQTGRAQTGRAQTGRAQTGRAQTGRAQTGRAQTGRAQTGRAQTGRAQTGRAQTGRAQTGRAQTGRAQTGRAQTGRAQTGRAQTGRAQTGRAQTGRAQTGRDQTGRDQTGRDQTGRDQTGRDQTGRDQTGRDQTGRDQTGRDQTGRDQTGRDQTGRDQTGRDQTGRDQTGRDQTGRVQTGRVQTVENEHHCDFIRLREMLLRTNMFDLIESTHNIHYELYRLNRLTALGINPTGQKKGPIEMFEDRRSMLKSEHEHKEAELKEHFIEKVKQKEVELKAIEQDIHAELNSYKQWYRENREALEEKLNQLNKEIASFESDRKHNNRLTAAINRKLKR